MGAEANKGTGSRLHIRDRTVNSAGHGRRQTTGERAGPAGRTVRLEEAVHRSAVVHLVHGVFSELKSEHVESTSEELCSDGKERRKSKDSVLEQHGATCGDRHREPARSLPSLSSSEGGSLNRPVL